MGRLSIVMSLAVALLAPSASSASPITLQYSGNWQFFDPPSDTPEFHAAMAAYGVFFGAPNPLSFSITVDPGVADSNPNPTIGLYMGAVVSSQLTIGSLSLSCAGLACAAPIPNFIGPIGAAELTPTSLQMVGALTSMPPLIGGLFTPSFFSFQSLPSLSSDSLASALSNVTGWPTPQITIGFQGTQSGFGLNLGASSLALVRVPETTTFVMLVSGALVLFFYRRRMRRSA